MRTHPTTPTVSDGGRSFWRRLLSPFSLSQHYRDTEPLHIPEEVLRYMKDIGITIGWKRAIQHLEDKPQVYNTCDICFQVLVADFDPEGRPYMRCPSYQDQDHRPIEKVPTLPLEDPSVQDELPTIIEIPAVILGESVSDLEVFLRTPQDVKKSTLRQAAEARARRQRLLDRALHMQIIDHQIHPSSPLPPKKENKLEDRDVTEKRRSVKLIQSPT